ncbi:PAS domain S-box protein [bacterium]|nr:PAS domain S-box protein [bacterium]
MQEEKGKVLEVIMENTDFHLAYLDVDFNFIKVNSAYARGSGHSKEELIGKNHFDLFPNKENQKIFEWVRDQGKPIHYKAKPFKYADQPERGVTYWDWSLNPVKDDSGKVRGLVLSLRDVTEGKKAEEKIKRLNNQLRRQTLSLESSNRELEAFNYSVSHDLMAPLRHIKGFTQALLEDCDYTLDEEGKEYFGRIIESVNHMNRLIQDLLRLSRITTQKLQNKKVDLTEMAREVLESFRKMDPDRKVEARVEEQLTAYGDMNLLRMAVENLINNAWKFTTPRETALIEVGKTEKSGKEVFFIRDNGVGFDMDYAYKLFIPFQRLHSEEKFQGMGIGLGLVSRIVHRHGGRIWAESELEKGASFYFTLKE